MYYVLVATFSGSKGGTGKTALAVSLSIMASGSLRSLLVDASAEGGVTAYVFGDAPGPYLSEDPEGSLRSVSLGDIRLTVAVNRGPLLWPERVAAKVREWAESHALTIVDLPALTDVDAVERYMPLLELTDAVLIVAEPNPASLEASLYRFGEKRVVVALNQPRPYPKSLVDHYARVVASWCKSAGAEYVVVPYEPAVSRMGPGLLRVFDFTSSEFDAAVAKLIHLLLRKR